MFTFFTAGSPILMCFRWNLVVNVCRGLVHYNLLLEWSLRVTFNLKLEWVHVSIYVIITFLWWRLRNKMEWKRMWWLCFFMCVFNIVMWNEQFNRVLCVIVHTTNEIRYKNTEKRRPCITLYPTRTTVSLSYHTCFHISSSIINNEYLVIGWLHYSTPSNVCVVSLPLWVNLNVETEIILSTINDYSTCSMHT